MDGKKYATGEISTHAPRTGSDVQLFAMWTLTAHFNPRSPHGERRENQADGGDADRFQPTLPARGATAALLDSQAYDEYFNPRSPHGERQEW